jgi:hypothetical protein
MTTAFSAPPTADEAEPTAPEPEQQTDRPAADADLGRIDEALHRNGEKTAAGDPHPASLLARLKVLAPPHAVFEHEPQVPKAVGKLIEKIADAVGADRPDSMYAHRVVWTTGEGAWQPTGIYQIGWTFCQVHNNEYQVEVDAPGIQLSRKDLTPDEAIALLRVLRIIH